MALNPQDPVNVQQPNPIIGTPVEDAAYVDGQQSYLDTCAIRAQEYILQQFTGQDIDEDALVREAYDNGWYTPGGTPLEAVGNLLELHGVLVNRYADANIFHLANELAQGHKVIVGVDKDEIWAQNARLERFQEAFRTDPGSDHAIVVSGIDTSDPHDIRVIVSDPGTGEPVASYPMNQFIDAWEDSSFFMVATQEPVPSSQPEMVNFDYDRGYIDQVANLPYEQFLTYEDRPGAWDDLFDPTRPGVISVTDGIDRGGDFPLPSTFDPRQDSRVDDGLGARGTRWQSEDEEPY